MSIYASFGGFDANDHKAGCRKLVRIRKGEYRVDESRRCTCKAGPIAYRGSNVLPSDDDPRGGCLSFAFIPGHIDDAKRKALSDTFPPYWPWLRVSIWGTGDDPTVILTRAQVEKVRDELNDWLEHAIKP